MRKFNVKGKAVRRMMGMPREEDERAAEAAGAAPAAASAESGMRFVWRTDVGRVRKNNQDAVIIGTRMAGVADGMGGHNAGEVASGGLRDGLLRETEGREPDAEALTEAVEKVNLELFRRQETDDALTGMGTTLTVLWAGEEEILLAQVGDSRAYLIRGGEMRQVTEDHSMVADMVRRGVLTEEQARCHPMRNYITRAVGTDETVDVDIYTEKRRAGDRWLICSDGLYGLMSGDALSELARAADPEEAADRLLQMALDNGGKDNISLVLADDLRGAPETAEEAADGTDAGKARETDEADAPDEAGKEPVQEGTEG